ncbi:uncharacterized protein V6R79_007181 [Siganus canaliculatus]
MLPFKRTFDSEKHQLQELNSRLFQYLSRTRQLEQENAHLIVEINKLRQNKVVVREPRHKDEMRELRRMVGQLSFEKSKAEMEREKLWRELQMVQCVCSEQTEICRDISGELKGCETELHNAHKTNSELQQRLFQLENEYKCLEDVHRQEIGHLRHEVESRTVPMITQTYRGPPAATMEEVEEYARGLSEGWMETFEMYQQKVEEMEQAIKADQAMLNDLQKEKMLYAAELNKLRTEAEKQGQFQVHLEEQLMHMQDKFRVDCSEYQIVIEQLEHERNNMADAIAEKMREHQHLLQVKMDLGMEVAAYRALLEGEHVGLQDVHRRVAQHQRERIIDIRLPAQPYTPRASTLTTRQHVESRYTAPASNLRRSPVPSAGSVGPSRVIPISVAERARHQSPASRRDMISFTKARAAASVPAATTAATKDKQTSQRESQSAKTTWKTQQVSQVEDQVSSMKSTTSGKTSVRVVSPPMMSLSMKTETESKKQVSKEKDVVDGGKLKDEKKTESATGPGEKKVLDSVSVEEIIEKVIKPAGLEAKVCSSGESKITYHVQKTEQDDGKTKTQIVLESKVEEELDMSEDSALEELLNQGIKKVSLEDIKDTETASMIKNLLSGLQGHEDLENKTVNVEIIEEPVESHSDEEFEVEQRSSTKFHGPSSTYFQIEELENVPHDAQLKSDTMRMSTTEVDHSKGGSVKVQDVSRETAASYFSHDQEPDEYFVSTPDDNISEPEEEHGGITSYGHYGILDDLSDERYYQDDGLPSRRVIVEESDDCRFMSADHSFVKESIPECIIEEEVRVSPVVQESVLEFLREDSLEPKEQLKGTLEKLQGSVSGPLKDELAFLSKVSQENPENVALNVKKVQQSNDNGTMTIVAELNVSQTLEDSGLLEAGDDLPEEQIMAALRSSNLGLEKVFQGGARGGYSIKVSKEETVAYGKEFEDFGNGESASEITEKHIQLEPSEKSFTFQMGMTEGQAEGTSEPKLLRAKILDTEVQHSQEKKIATVYLESPTDD